MEQILGDLAPFAVALLGVGLIAGLMAGLLGIGGGIVIVPFLFHIYTELGVPLDVRQKAAVATSLATILPTALSSIRAHHARGAVDIALLRRWGPSIMAGVLLGTALVGLVHGTVLQAVFACVALVVALWMSLSREHWRLSEGLPREPWRGLIGAVIGTVSAMMGIGGATLAVPVQVLCGVPVHRAVGTAAAIGLLIAVPGIVGTIIAGGLAERWLTLDEGPLPPLSLGYVHLAGFALIVPATVIAAPWGARLAHALPRRALRLVFAGFLAYTALRMVWQLAAT